MKKYLRSRAVGGGRDGGTERENIERSFIYRFIPGPGGTQELRMLNNST